MSAPKVSVILPTFRRPHLIGRALRSVLMQSYRDLEVLVLDDAPGDGTEAAVRAFGDPRVRYVANPAQRGAAANRNQGLELARGELVAFQDSDDEWLTGKLEHQVARLQALPPDVALTQAAVLRYEGGNVRYLLTRLPERDQQAAMLTLNHTTFLQGWLARRAALIEAGGFDGRLSQWEDWELALRLCQKHRIDIDPLPVAIVFDTPGSLMKAAQRRTAGLQLILAKHRPSMQAHPRALAENVYALARFQLLDGDAAAARRSLAESLRLNPWRAKTWLLLALSLLRTSVVRSIIDWRESRA